MRKIIFLTICLGLLTPSLSIIFGTTIIPHSMPYTVALQLKGNSNHILCGGTLVSRNYVLTAARCLFGTQSITVVLGAHNINHTNERQVHIALDNKSFNLHPHFNATSLENDIALVKLPKPVTLTSTIDVIKVATELDVEKLNLTGQWAISAGWGMVSYDRQTYSSDLEALWTNVMDNYHTECDKEFGDRIKHTNICCSGGTVINSPVNICEGDFGGPLILQRQKFLIGIASFTTTNCALGEPNVFTSVMKYSVWIASNSDVKFDTVL